MRSLFISGLMLVLLFSVCLVNTQSSLRIFKRTWEEAREVLPSEKIQAFTVIASSYRDLVFQSLPLQLRKQAMTKGSSALELMIFRALLVWHVVPSFLLAVVIGLLEGVYARKNQQALVKVHSPIWFSSSLVALALVPIAAFLWVAAPVAIPPSVPGLLLFAVCGWAWRNLIVHAPTQF